MIKIYVVGRLEGYVGRVLIWAQKDFVGWSIVLGRLGHRVGPQRSSAEQSVGFLEPVRPNGLCHGLSKIINGL